MEYSEIISKIKYIAENYKEEPTGGWISGDGPIPADIMFVGEAPGKTEIEQGKPFVGVAGKTFEGYLKAIGIERSQVRISNSCFFRPIKIKEGKNGKESISNRTPKTSEVELFRKVLDEEILLVNPKIIVTLGNIPLKRLTNFKSIGECHGDLFFNDTLKKHIFPMYHPSALTYNRNEAFEKMYEEDWKKLEKALKEI